MHARGCVLVANAHGQFVVEVVHRLALRQMLFWWVSGVPPNSVPHCESQAVQHSDARVDGVIRYRFEVLVEIQDVLQESRQDNTQHIHHCAQIPGMLSSNM